MSRRWKGLLELQLRKVHGIGFQDFVGAFMGRLYPDDFIPVKAHGRLGDGGNDGFRLSDGTLYQCYGAHNGHVHDINYVCAKLEEDFEKARLSTPQMKNWRFTHNLTDMPQPLLQTYLDLVPKIEAYGIKPGLFGKDGFQALLPRFSEDDLEDLIGIAVHSKLDTERLPESVRLLVKRVMDGMDSPIAVARDMTIPPQEKLEFNAIPERWRKNIVMNLTHADIVTEIIGVDTKATDAMPFYMKSRYLDLVAQGLDAGEILKHLYEDLAGYINEFDGRYEASIAIIAALFESCVIFKDKGTVVLSESVT